jgi:hypothetical protein
VSARQHSQHDPRQTKRGHQESQQHPGIAPQLKHQQQQHDDQRDRKNGKDRAVPFSDSATAPPSSML